MANEEHVELLLSGVDGWNRWVKEYHYVRPDLSGAELTSAELRNAYLCNADLRNGDLTGVDLTFANLEGADLYRAKLTGAKLTGAKFTNAYLADANLSDANLFGAVFNNTILDGAHFTSADFGVTVIGNVDLRQTKGLESVRHLVLSTLGTNTLERSHGQIPRAFLKGCGLTDWQIENARLFDPDLDADQRTTIWYEIERIRSEQAIHWFRVFISYTRSDEPFVEALEELLDKKGVRYWRDVHDMKAGRLERQIDRAIDLNPLVLLVLSERSVESEWVEWEAAKARDLERRYRLAGNPRDVLCPVMLDDAWERCAWPGRLRRQIAEYNILDFSGWEDDEEMAKAFAKLYEGVILNYRPEGGEAR